MIATPVWFTLCLNSGDLSLGLTCYSKSSAFPPGFAKETLQTLDLLFPNGKGTEK
jgi:hypothetical protein